MGFEIACAARRRGHYLYDSRRWRTYGRMGPLSTASSFSLVCRFCVAGFVLKCVWLVVALHRRLTPSALGLAAQFKGGRGLNMVVSVKQGSYLRSR